MNVNHFFLACLIIVLAGCVNAPEVKHPPSSTSALLYKNHLQSIAHIDQFSLQGRIGVQTNSKGFSGSLIWQHDAANDDIALYSPLGSQVANIKKTIDKVVLEDANKNSISAENAEILTQTALGWKLPLSGLVDWTLGRPASSQIQSITWNEQGFLSTLKQDDWNIEYENYIEYNGLYLPSKILLKSEKVNLKLLVEKWLSLDK